MPKLTDRIAHTVGLSRRTVTLALACAVAPVGTVRAAGSALALIMVDDPACHFCRKFDAEVGRGYPKTGYAAVAPLTRIRRKSAELRAYNPVIYTPTFLLVRRGEELGRITGYPGAEFFYSELDELLLKIGVAPGAARTANGSRT
jgi:hypothetical protein